MANRNYNRNKPKWEWGDGWTSKGMTEKQFDYINVLVEKASLILTEDIKTLSRGGASNLINELKRVVDYGESTHYLRRDWGRFFEFE